MHSLERGKRHEKLGNAIGRIAYAYGFTAAPVTLSRKAVANQAASDAKTSAAMALIDAKNAPVDAQSWGAARSTHGTVIAFSVSNPRHAIAHAIAVKTALAVAEEAGYAELAVEINSVGDQESRKRFARELGNFFRKNIEALAPEVRELAARDPEAAYRKLVALNDPVRERAPRSIDYLSENARKNMLSVLSFFESVGIPYTMNPRLVGDPGVHSEILFAIEGTNRRGERLTVATGGRYESPKRERGKTESAVGMSVEVPERIDLEALDEAPACFVVHVGDIAKLRAFSVLEALWRAHIAVGQALMAETLRDQMLASTGAKTRYVAIIGQREALDGTVIIRNASTQIQTVLPLEKLTGYVGRGQR
ncbi:MAG: ATP phosphoribosyltransferase regulatory subunit [Patescibacteria group bacterium]|nr:ATP phosphoribosyltransferase regulatory subunit [Patescibacteria group bacterium]